MNLDQVHFKMSSGISSTSPPLYYIIAQDAITISHTINIKDLIWPESVHIWGIPISNYKICYDVFLSVITTSVICYFILTRFGTPCNNLFTTRNRLKLNDDVNITSFKWFWFILCMIFLRSESDPTRLLSYQSTIFKSTMERCTSGTVYFSKARSRTAESFSLIYN